ncbi:hypothetical protein [Amorphus coralli]|uniref:hypothetical protein n=1 Tax=Amorphus coralli TaxID=340680 RepID=UPI000475E135|nr:hypothetical protein [Amorphus coralli]
MTTVMRLLPPRLGARIAEFRQLDRRRRKYLTTKYVLKLEPVLPGKFAKKMKRRLAKYSPFPQPATKPEYPGRTARIRLIEADLKRAAGRIPG